MASGFALIPCEVCNNLFPIEEYTKHTATHQVQYDYNTGNMYGPNEGGQGPLPKPSNYKEPETQPTVTTKEYVTQPDGTKDYYNNGDMYGGKSESKTDDSKTAMDDEKKNEIQDISNDNANSVRDKGCCVIKNGIRPDLIKNALRLINNALSKGPQCLQQDEYIKNYDILDLFNESAAFSLCQNILGMANVIIPRIAEIKLIFPERNEMDEKQVETMELNWNIDGLEDGILASYSLGMRMILSKQKFRFYKGTHMEVFNRLKIDGMDKFVQGNKEEKDRKEWEKNRLEVLDVDKGDIVLYHPFLCLPLVECHNKEDIEYYVSFRVNHKNFDKEVGLKRERHLWLGYEMLKNALVDEVLII